jgi:ketosteroid isomerase-like protein
MRASRVVDPKEQWMTEQENVQLIQELYAAFGRGDVPAILDQLTDDVVWYDPGPPEVPHAGSYSGREGVGRFFAKGDRVVVLGSLHARVKETGRSYDNEWAMVWTLRDGKVAGWQIYEDTAREFAGPQRVVDQVSSYPAHGRPAWP